jgi:hypothetical protein
MVRAFRRQEAGVTIGVPEGKLEDFPDTVPDGKKSCRVIDSRR